MFNSSKQNKNVDDFLKQTEEARIKRQLDKQKILNAIRIQSYYRGYRVRKQIKESLKNELNQLFNYPTNYELNKNDLKTNSTNLYLLIQKYLFLDKNSTFKTIFENICKYLTFSIVNGELKNSYISLAVSKDNYQNFLTQSKRLIKICVENMIKLNIKDVNNLKSLTVYLNLIVTLTTHQMWKCFQSSNTNELLEKMLNGLSNSYLIYIGTNLNIYESFHEILLQNLLNYKPILKPTITSSIVNLSIRILQINNYSHQNLLNYCKYILINPALIKHLIDSNSNEIIQQFKEIELTNRIYSTLSVPEKVNEFLQDKDLNQSIAFLGNLCSLAKLDLISLKLNVEIFISLSTIIFEHCCEIVSKSKGQNNTIWHPFVGYINNKSCKNHSESLLNIFEQLKFLWTHQFITVLFDSTTQNDEIVTKANFKGFVKGIFDKALKKESNQIYANESSSVFRICTFYRKLLFLFSEPKIEILSALSVEEELMLGLWRYIHNLGPNLGLKDLIKLLENEHKFQHPIFDVFYLLTSLTQYIVTIFDEYEFYEKQNIFKLDDYKMFATFLNNFLYKIISNELIDLKTLDTNNYFITFHQLLSILNDKDNQRSFTSNDFWIIKDVKIKSFISDFEREKLSAVTILNKIPHIIPHKYRVEILQNIVQKDKLKTFGEELSQIRIKIRRNRVVEDGYQQLANLPTDMYKSTIRVVFVNEYGLNEAGIDQDGVFKEFVQEILKKILNPEFNLFRVTEEQQLYPSPSSYFVDDHLKLFEFVGKVFAKAIYEGVVVDVQFAPFFLRQIIGYRCQNYSFFDDLATLDRDLYKNLSLIKREMDEETLSSLELTFTYTESHLGSLVTHDLVPSGNFIKVNSENKIKYIHLLALFKLHKQIKKQVFAFNEGFKSIIKQEWLNMFSLPELQRLISGSCLDIDLDDLKKHVQYWGGLHSGHRLIKWLWEILENDFDREERGLFLKFVTSCSKPPLLGFSSLNPPFTIRCVEVEEAEGTIYDASLTGFFKTIMNISNKDTSRLPTSSTCFNLLKLPNYSKKSSLRDKLRYAIRSNAGFELS